MPDLTPQSTPPHDPSQSWEDRPAFRESFLLYFTRPEDRKALEHIGNLLYENALELAAVWPAWEESSTRAEMRAAAGDLRHVQGVLASVNREREVSSLDPEDAYLATIAGKLSRQLGKVAEWIENELKGVAGHGMG